MHSGGLQDHRWRCGKLSQGWYSLTVQVELQGETSEDSGNLSMGRMAYVRASNRYRTADFFLSEKPLEPGIRGTWDRSAALFRNASTLFDSPIECALVPYENTTIPVYFYRETRSPVPGRQSSCIRGFDGTKEETFPGRFAAAV